MTFQVDHRSDFYKILGVSKDAEAEAIKKAYRKLAKQYHPDRTGGDKAKEARFKEISQAYEVLGDPEKRRQYDALRAGGFPGGYGSVNGFPGQGSGDFTVDPGGLGDLFSQMFSGGSVRRGPGGVEYHFTRGGNPFDASSPFRRSAPFHEPSAPPVKKRPVARDVRLSDGSTAIQRGIDVYSDVRLAMDQAILGAVVQVATLEGTAKVKIPPGTSSGVKLRLKNKGAVSADGSQGSHFVTVQIDVPKVGDEQGKKLLIQFMQHAKKA